MPIFDTSKKKEQVELHKSIFVAEKIWKETQDIIYSNESFYRWRGNVYEKIKDIDWMIFISDNYPTFNEFSPRIQKEIMEVYKRFAYIPKEQLNSENGLCLNNKYLDLDKIDVFDHDLSRYNTLLVPYDYDKDAKCPLWESTIKDIMQGDLNKIKSLQEFFGYCLTRDTSQRKAMFLVGESNTGKSTILETLQAMIGEDNCSFVSLRHFVDTVRMAAIENKLVNIVSEIPKKAEDYEEIYKKVCGGEKIDINPKYIQNYSFRPYCKMIFALNEWPHIDDKTHAFYNRMLLIECDRVYAEEEQDKKLRNKLLKELSGILNWSIEGLKRIKEKGCFTANEYMRNAIKEIRLMNNPISLYAEEKLYCIKGEYIDKTKLYKDYCAWSNNNGYKALSKIKFGFEIYRIFKEVTKKNGWANVNNKSIRVWPNIQFKDLENVEGQEEIKDWEE